MALHGKVEAQVEPKSAADKFYNIWKKETHKIPTITSNNIQGIDLHEGDWGAHGAVKSWSYSIGNYCYYLIIENQSSNIKGFRTHFMCERSERCYTIYLWKNRKNRNKHIDDCN